MEAGGDKRSPKRPLGAPKFQKGVALPADMLILEAKMEPK